MKTAMRIVWVAAALAVVGCDKPDAKTSDPTAATATAPAANTATNTTGAAQAKLPEPPAIADSDLVSPADYESEEETAITAKNYKAEIATIETEMAKE